MSDKYNNVADKLSEIENHIIKLKNDIESMIEYVNEHKQELVTEKSKELKNGNRESNDEDSRGS